MEGQAFSCPERCKDKTVLPAGGVTKLITDWHVEQLGTFLKRKAEQRSGELRRPIAEVWLQ